MRGIAEYHSVSLESASNEQLVVMLYEAAVRHQQIALEALEDGDFEDGRHHLRRCRDIFGELLVALDYDTAPELASNLARLYRWLITELGHAGFDRNAATIKGTLRVTRNLLGGWSEALGFGSP